MGATASRPLNSALAWSRRMAFFQRRSETYGAEGSKLLLAQHEDQLKNGIGQFYLADLLLPLVVFLVRDLQ